MKATNVFGRNLRQFSILDNAEGDINSVWKDERTGEFFMESLIQGCNGYVYFKASKEDILKFLDQKITLEKLFEKGMKDEVFIHIFEKHGEEKRRNLCEIKFHCEGLYQKIGVGVGTGNTELFDRIRKQIEEA
ncbi:MAG TPA: hypothetical protein ENN58_00885 [bacterium]|nr:hypothetical protein [bacterium]